MSRGKPCTAQLDLANAMFDMVNANASFITENGMDVRNYGGLDGIPEMKKLFAALLTSTKNGACRGRIELEYYVQSRPAGNAIRRRRRTALEQTRQSQIHLPCPRLRPSFCNHRTVRHRYDCRAFQEGRQRGYRRNRRACRKRFLDKRHLVRAEIQQPDGRYLQRRRRYPPCKNGRRKRLPHFLGQRLCRAQYLRRRCP